MGQVFGGRYELIDPIADGGMGSVWRVRDHEDGSIKAAKVLRHRDASSLLRFIREQGTRIHHPHVVTPLGWVGADDRADLPSTPLGALLALATDPDPALRPPTAAAFAEAVRRAVPPAPWMPGEVEVIDHFAAIDEPATSEGDQPWWPIALLAVLGLALVAVGLVVLL